MTTFSPQQTAGWSEADWAALVGEVVTVVVDGRVYDDRRTVRAVRFGPGPVVVVEWQPEGSLAFARDPGAEITVHGVGQ